MPGLNDVEVTESHAVPSLLENPHIPEQSSRDSLSFQFVAAIIARKQFPLPNASEIAALLLF